MQNLALFDLDHTLLPLDSDYEWGKFLTQVLPRSGEVNAQEFSRRNSEYFLQYQHGSLDPVAYLEFALGTLAHFPRAQLDAWHAQFMQEVIQPALLAPAFEIIKQHQEQDDLVAIITATNRFVTEPIATALGIKHLMAAEPELDQSGNITGKLYGVPSSGIGKVVHLQAWLKQHGKDMRDFPKTYFYSDSHNDIPLLSIVSHPIATNPSTTLLAHAEKKAWTLLYLFK
ncbi:MAG: HAD-IB family hydrolase [Undibacterium sp.]|nr:HAD-IB family hydrolase [Undibacterium sp.]